jgi:putative ABC transport system substrate-binding protein
MRRREFITLIGGTAVTWPLAVRGEQADRLHRIGVLTGTPPDDPDTQIQFTALLEEFSTRGWREGSNLHVEWRMTGATNELYQRYAAELVALNAEVVVAIGSPSAKVL